MGWLITYPSVLSELVSSSRTPRVPQLHSPRKLPCSPCDVLCAVSSAQKTSSAIQKRFSVSLSLRLGLQPVRTPSTSLWVTRYAGGQDPAPSTSDFMNISRRARSKRLSALLWKIHPSLLAAQM